MAKVQTWLFCLFLLCSCRNNGLHETGLTPADQRADSIAVIVDSAVQDLPVVVDTSHADTARVPVVVAITETVQQKDTQAVTVIKNPSLQEIYSAYIGVREATGNNDGKQVERFLKNVGLGKGFPWCAAYVKTCLLEAGIKSASKINGMALSCENKAYFVYRARSKIEPVRSGDVFTLWYANLKRIGHTGFVDHDVNGTVYESVEGNTNAAGSREGDGVYRKKRSYNATHSVTRWRD